MGTNGYNPIDDYRFDGSNKLKIAKVDAAGKPFSTGNKADDNARLAEVATRLDALQDVQAQYGMPVVSIANLDDLLGYLDNAGDPALAGYRAKAAAYRDKYGVSAI